MGSSSLDRRAFLLSSLSAAPATPIRLGVIGSGSRGTFVMGVFQSDPSLAVAAICDVYEPNLENAISAAARRQPSPPRAIRNYRQLLDDKSIDAVLIATPEHWHHRMVLDALAAGKDVYVEKPLCHTPEQGVELLDAEARSSNIIQVGMQRRSYDLYQEGARLVAAGTLGSVHMIRSWWLNTQLGGARATRLDGPLDWNQWFGPAGPRQPDPDIFRRWRLYSDLAGGIVADQGAHVYDGIHMLMNAGYPLAVTAAAGRPHAPSGDTPECVVVTAEYPQDFIGVFTINYATVRYPSRLDQMNHLDGTIARMDIGREDLRVFSPNAPTPLEERRSERGFGYATDLHVRNFLDSVRTRRRPTAPIALGFQAALVVQMANLSLKSGRRQTWNPKTRKVESL